MLTCTVKETLDATTRGAVLSREYAEFQDLLLALSPSAEREALGTLLRHLARRALAEADPGDLAAFRRYAERDPEEAGAFVRVLAAEAVQAAQEILGRYPGLPVPPVPSP